MNSMIIDWNSTEDWKKLISFFEENKINFDSVNLEKTQGKSVNLFDNPKQIAEAINVEDVDFFISLVKTLNDSEMKLIFLDKISDKFYLERLFLQTRITANSGGRGDNSELVVKQKSFNILKKELERIKHEKVITIKDVCVISLINSLALVGISPITPNFTNDTLVEIESNSEEIKDKDVIIEVEDVELEMIKNNLIEIGNISKKYKDIAEKLFVLLPGIDEKWQNIFKDCPENIPASIPIKHL